MSYKGYTVYKDKEVEQNRILLNANFNKVIEKEIKEAKVNNNDKYIDVLKDNKNDFKDSSNDKQKTNNYNIIGKIEIDKIKHSSIIIDGATKENLDIGICKVSGNRVNTIGNLVLAGHNMKDGSLFGNLHLLNIGDTFRVIDNKGAIKKYKIYRKKVISPYDLSILSETKDKTRVTLFTCTQQGKKRLVLYGIAEDI